MRKAQISIEFLTILSLFLLIFLGLSLDIIKLATRNIVEIYEIGVWKADKVVLDEASNFVKFVNGGKLVYLRVPVDCNMIVNGGNTIDMKCTTFNDTYFSPYARFIPKSTINPGDYVPVMVVPIK